MYLDKEHFDSWMHRIMERLDRLDLQRPTIERGQTILPDGSKLLDNTDLCQMLNISKRTLQRYRSLGELPYQMIYHKTFYREEDVLNFISTHFDRLRAIKKKK